MSKRMDKPEFTIKADPFSWDDNFSEVALEDFSKIQNDLPYVMSQNIGMALAKLKMLEETAAGKKKPDTPDGFVTVDFPESCLNCDFCHEREYDNRQMIQGKRFCGIENVEVDKYCSDERAGKPYWCPIRTIPEKKSLTGDVSNIVKMGNELVKVGWNACIDDLLNDGD